jgi:hypothetical protein
MTTTGTPRIWSEHPSLDTLTELPGIQVPGSKLCAGMVLLDPDLKTPAASLDHKTRTVRGSGDVSFLVLDYDQRTFDTIAIHASTLVWVAAE